MIDYSHVLKDPGLLAASAAGQVDSEDKIVDVGAGRLDGKLVVDVTAIEIDSTELYKISLQGSSSSTFASAIEDLAILELGPAAALGGDVASTVGRYEVPFSTEKAGTKYRYLREYCAISGTVSTGINFSAYLAKV